MIKGLFFNQKKPTTVIVLGIVFLTLAVLVLIENSTHLEQIITMLFIAMILLGYSISFEMNADFNHKKHFKLFAITIFRRRLECFIPEYITVFSTTGVKNSAWGPVASIGTQTKDQDYVVRLFKGNSHFTLFRTTSYNKAIEKAEQLGVLLQIEVRIVA